MRLWRDRGWKILDLAGSGDYKKKYHPRPIVVPWFRVSRYPLLGPLRELARESYLAKQRILGRLAPTFDLDPESDHPDSDSEERPARAIG
jgi:hypothetical protein